MTRIDGLLRRIDQPEIDDRARVRSDPVLYIGDIYKQTRAEAVKLLPVSGQTQPDQTHTQLPVGAHRSVPSFVPVSVESRVTAPGMWKTSRIIAKVSLGCIPGT